MTAHVRFQRRAARAAGLMTRYCPRDGLLLSFPGLAGWIDDQGDEQDVVVRAPVTGPVYPRLTLWLEMTGVPYGRTTR